MEGTGTLLVRTFLSRAQFPVPGATAVVASAQPDGRYQLLAARITDESGLVGPFTLEAPEASVGLTPNGGIPFSNYLLMVEHPEYEMEVYLDLQVFPGIQTVQEVPMIPRQAQGAEEEITVVTPQPL